MSGASEVPAERDEAIIAEATVEVIRAALKWADWCAGQGICAVESEGITAPDDFLVAYTDKTGDEEWDTMADRIAERASRPVDTGREKALEGLAAVDAQLALAARLLVKQSLTPEERCFDALAVLNSARSALASQKKGDAREAS